MSYLSYSRCLRRRTFMSRLLLSLLAVVCFQFGKVESFGRGAPGDVEKTRYVVCDELRPVHYDAPFQEESTNPFTVRVGKLPQKGSVQVVLGVREDKEETLIMGFLVQGRDKNNAIIGTFDTTATENITLTCQNTTVSQHKKQWKKEVKLVWLAPRNFKGEVHFQILVLENTTVFWKFDAEERPYIEASPEPASKIRRKSSSDDQDGAEPADPCAGGSGCFRCPGNSCLVRWTPTDRTIRFEVEMKVTEEYSQPYVAVALSLDQSMGADSVTECTRRSDGLGVVQMSWNNGYANEALGEPLRSIVPETTSVVATENFLRCSFERYLYSRYDPAFPPSSSSSSSSSATTTDMVYYPGEESYYLLVAMGDLESEDPEGGITLAHHTEKFASKEKINFTAVSLVRGKEEQEVATSNDKYLVKAHGVIMTVAWLFFASLASLLPRYFKKKLPGVKVLKKPFWFALHQGLMLCVVALTILSFILIFVEVGGYAQLPNPGSAHPPLGILVTILVVVNPIMALFRCDSASKNRWIFDLFHFFVGQSAMVLAVVVIFLSVTIKRAGLPYWLNWVLTWHVCWHVMVELLLTAHDKYSQSTTPVNPTNDILMIHEKNNETERPKTKSLFASTRLPPAILAGYTLVSLVTTIVVSGIISTA